MTTSKREDIGKIVTSSPQRVQILEAVARLALPDCWIAAGFVRNAVWDYHHLRPEPTRLNDVDVAYYNPDYASPEFDREIEQILHQKIPGQIFSVKNQARMHIRNNDAEYRSTLDALAHWPETCTAVGVRLADGRLDILAPFGLDDLDDLLIRPTSEAPEIRQLVRKRCMERRWLEIWPRLRLIDIDY